MTRPVAPGTAVPHRWCRAVGAGLALVLLLVGCDAASSGKPVRSTTAAGTSSGDGPTGRPSGAAATGLANAPLCRDFRAAGGRLGDVRSADGAGARLWAQLAADAPAAIKPDAQVVARFAAEVAAGRPSAPGLAPAVRAVGRVTDWATRNCI